MVKKMISSSVYMSKFPLEFKVKHLIFLTVDGGYNRTRCIELKVDRRLQPKRPQDMIDSFLIPSSPCLLKKGSGGFWNGDSKPGQPYVMSFL